jgi:hypothetical protein
MESLYQELINDRLRRIHAEQQKERGSDAGEWHPSSLTGCERAATYSYIGEPKSDETTTQSMVVMQRGTELHEVIQSEMARRVLAAGGAPSSYLVEVKVEYGGISGSCDALLAVADGYRVEGDDDGDEQGHGLELEPVYEVQEYKSIKSLHFVKNFPKEDHVMQARIYAWGLKKMGYLLDGIRIVYLERETFKVIEHFVQTWTDEEELAFEDTIENLDHHVAEGTLPDQMPDDYWLCRYCDWRTTCKGAK